MYELLYSYRTEIRLVRCYTPDVLVCRNMRHYWERVRTHMITLVLSYLQS
jgi:hypothetical protein